MLEKYSMKKVLANKFYSKNFSSKSGKNKTKHFSFQLKKHKKLIIIIGALGSMDL